MRKIEDIAIKKKSKTKPKTFVKQRSTSYRIDWCQNELSLDWISYGKTDTACNDERAYVYTYTGTHSQRYQSAPEGRSGPGDGRMDGWKRIKLSVINNAV